MKTPPAAQEYDRPNSAFMLFYERSEELEPCRQPRPQPTPPEQPSAAAGATGTAAGANPMLNTQSSSGGAATQQATTAAAGAPLAAGGTGGGMPPAVLPSLFADVMEENLALAERIHLLDADYLRCLGATQFRMPLGAPDLWRACAIRTSCRWTRPRC